METQTPNNSVAQFFGENYPSLKKYCHSKWNGSGDDVLHEAFIIASQRYLDINFSLFTRLAAESARKLKISQ